MASVTNHTITVPANTTAIVYTWTGQPTTSFAGTSALSVIVTATAQNGYILFNAPAGWTVNAARTSATFTLTAPAASCRTVTPGTPTATAASCAAGVVTNHVITVPANTADITYTWTPQGTAGNATTYTGTAALDVTVTATLVGAGTGWPATLARLDADRQHDRHLPPPGRGGQRARRCSRARRRRRRRRA